MFSKQLVTTFLLGAAAAVVTLGVYASSLGGHFTIVPVQQACTDEAKVCPDGSAVGRTGPNCTFAECPTLAIPATIATTTKTSNIGGVPRATTTTYACNADAKQCPDGTSVGRTGADCHFAACPTAPTQDSSVVTGVVVLSPTCPNESATSARSDGTVAPQDCAPRPYATDIMILMGSDGGTVQRIKSNAEGAFSTNLVPGTYTLVAAGGAVYPRCERKQIQVVKGEIVRTQITCDTGIR